MSRKSARESAFKLIYQIPFHMDADIESIIELYSLGEDYAKLDEKDREYVLSSVKGCFDNIDAIDQKISRSLKNWTIDRISKVNLAIMRLSLSEIDCADVPYQVSINEAVELAKKFSDDDAPSFVNGVLADIIK